MESHKTLKAIVVGASAGGLYALSTLFEALPANYPLTIIVVQHRHKDQQYLLEQVLQSKCSIKIKQADEKEKLEKAMVYIAPPDYHLLIESNLTFSLSSDAPVCYSRPSIDVLFESAACVFGPQLAGVLLTGANKDGAAGMLTIARLGGLTIAQSPEEAQYSVMPQSAINNGAARLVLSLADIQKCLLTLFK